MKLNFLEGLGLAAIVAWSLFIIAFVYGYVCNVIAIFQTMTDPITGMFIARLVGVLAAPLGAILGYF